MAAKRDDWREGYRRSGWNKYSAGYGNGASWRRALRFSIGSAAGKSSAAAGLGVLVIIGIVLLATHHDESKSSVEDNAATDRAQSAATPPQAQPKHDAHPASSQQPDAAQNPPPSGDATAPLPAAQAKPSPYAGAYSNLSVRSPDATSRSTAAVLPDRPVVFTATHKQGWGGGCTGRLYLGQSGLRFTCPDRADLNFPLDSIAAVDKDGVILRSGKKYHFKIDGMNAAGVNFRFRNWLARASGVGHTTGPAAN